MVTTSTSSFSTTSTSYSSSTPLPLNETLPVSLPDETTVSPLVAETTESDKVHLNATTMSSVPSSSTHMSLEGVDYRQSNTHCTLKIAINFIPKLKLFLPLLYFSLWTQDVPRSENCWRHKSNFRSVAVANFIASMANFNLSSQVWQCIVE
jgi:hypothetical protein